MRRLVLAPLAVSLLLAASAAHASQYPAWGDTGWNHSTKRDCCHDAIGIAQQESAAACRNIGGRPSPTRGGVQRRGSCTWESTRGADGATVFRCYAEASLWCR